MHKAAPVICRAADLAGAAAVSEADCSGHVGFTGTRNGMTYAQTEAVAELLHGYKVLHHGDCVGSDRQAHGLATVIGLKTESHPPKNPTLRAYCMADVVHEPKDYIPRDRDIVDASCRLIAAPAGMTEAMRSGTWTTVRYARKVGQPVSIVYPDGSVEHG